MRRCTILLIALCLLGALLALSCGDGGGDNEPAASPTSDSAVGNETPTASPASTIAAVPTAGVTAAPTDDEPTRHFELLQLCLGVNDEGWRQVCAAVASQSVSKCSQMPDTGPVGRADMQAVCGFLVAAATGDTLICDDIRDVAPGFDPASFALGEHGADCYMYVAVAAKDAALCQATQSPAVCERNIAVAAGAVPLDQCNDIDCLFDYAFRNQSIEACDKLEAMGEELRVDCLVMLDRDPSLCDTLEGLGVTQREACVSWALYGQARSAPEGFEFSVCGDDVICLFRALHDMADYIASGQAP